MKPGYRKVRFVQATSPYSVGEMATFNPTVALRLVNGGAAVYVDGPKKGVAVTEAPKKVGGTYDKTEVQTEVKEEPQGQEFQQHEADQPDDIGGPETEYTSETEKPKGQSRRRKRLGYKEEL